MSLICAGCNAFSAQVVLCGSCRMPHCPECAVRHAQDRACVKPSITLYPYQVEAVVRAMADLFGPTKSSLVVMATGLGKTVTSAEIARRWLRARGGRVLIVSHREELVHQAAKEFGQYLGNRVEVEMASDRANRTSGRWTSPVVSASIATLVAGRACAPCKEKLQAERADWLIKHPDKTIDDWRGHKIGCVNCLGGMVRRIQEFESGSFGLVIIDEAHHAVAKSYQRVVEYLQKTAGAAVLGVTATPDRSDERTLGAIFHSDRFYRYELPDALRDGWLVEPNEVYCRIDSWDLGNVKKDSHDFVQSSLAKEVEKEKSCYEVASAILQHAANKRTLGFCGSVQQAHRVAEILNDDRPGAAVAIDGETDKAFRRKCLADFAAGRIQFVLNFGVFTEGFNERTIECLAMARPTKSRSLYLQMLGRGTRTLQGVLDGIDSVQGRLEAIRNSKKSRLLVLDMHGQAGQHELISVVDVIGQKLSPRVIDIVKKLARENPARTVQELTDMAAEKARKQEERRAARQAASAARARSTLIPSRTNTPAPQRQDTKPIERPNRPTPRMIAAMRAHGVEESRIEKCTIGEAGLIIGMIKKREQMGLCDWRQARMLRKLDITPTNVGRVEAHEIIMRAMRAGKLQ